jgi:hypothetical protein
MDMNDVSPVKSYKPSGALLSPQVKVTEQHKRPGQNRNGQGLSRTVATSASMKLIAVTTLVDFKLI